jgi:anti-anti-sigma regulatory factor
MLQLEGDLTIINAVAVHQQLLQALEQQRAGEPLQLAVAEDADLDLSLLQLLVSTLRTARKRQIEVTMASPMPEQLERSLRLVGLMQPGEAELDQERIGKNR